MTQRNSAFHSLSVMTLMVASGITVMAALAWLQDQTMSRLDRRHHDISTAIASLVKRNDDSDPDDEDQSDPEDDGEKSPGADDPPFNPDERTQKR